MLRQILEQSHEWNSSLYVVFVEFEKAFDSLHIPSLWKILRHHGIPQKLLNITHKKTLNTESCTISSCQNLSEWTPVSNKDASCHQCSSPWQWTGSCELSPKEDSRTLMTVLEGLDYAETELFIIITVHMCMVWPCY